MPDVTYEASGDCWISYETETPAEYAARTGEHIGNAEPPLIGSVALYVQGKLAGEFPTREEARKRMSQLATVATVYPILEA
jgi:hypothetical protein